MDRLTDGMCRTVPSNAAVTEVSGKGNVWVMSTVLARNWERPSAAERLDKSFMQ